MSTLREGRWLCKSCGAECRGRDEDCNGDDGISGCNAPRPENTRFYLPESSPYITNADLIADARSGVDWYCDHCTGANKGAVNGHPVISCAHCGNGRDAQDKDNIERDVTGNVLRTATAATQAERTETHTLPPSAFAGNNTPTDWAGTPDASPQPSSLSPKSPSSAGKPSQKGKAFGVLIALGVALLITFLIWSFAFSRTQTVWTVSEHGWARTVQTEVFRTLTDEGWSPPRDARILDTERRIRSYTDVFDHNERRFRDVSDTVPNGTEQYKCGTRDLGNGFFEDKTCTRQLTKVVMRKEAYDHPIYRKVPVFDTWSDWEVDRWVHEKTWTAGNTGTARAWPVLPEMRRDQRVASQDEDLWITLAQEEEARRWPVNESVWLRLPAQSAVTMTTDFWGKILAVEADDGTALDFRP